MIRYFLSATLLIASIATQAFAMREIPGIHIPSSSIRTANTRLPEPIKELAQKVIESANDNSDLHNKVCNFLYARERLINSFVLEKIAASAGRDDKALDIISLDYINLQGELLASFPKEIQKIFESIDNEIEKENLGMSFFEILTIYENRDAFAQIIKEGVKKISLLSSKFAEYTQQEDCKHDKCFFCKKEKIINIVKGIFTKKALDFSKSVGPHFLQAIYLDSQSMGSNGKDFITSMSTIFEKYSEIPDYIGCHYNDQVINNQKEILTQFKTFSEYLKKCKEITLLDETMLSGFNVEKFVKIVNEQLIPLKLTYSLIYESLMKSLSNKECIETEKINQRLCSTINDAYDEFRVGLDKSFFSDYCGDQLPPVLFVLDLELKDYESDSEKHQVYSIYENIFQKKNDLMIKLCLAKQTVDTIQPLDTNQLFAFFLFDYLHAFKEYSRNLFVYNELCRLNVWKTYPCNLTLVAEARYNENPVMLIAKCDERGKLVFTMDPSDESNPLNSMRRLLSDNQFAPLPSLNTEPWIRYYHNKINLLKKELDAAEEAYVKDYLQSIRLSKDENKNILPAMSNKPSVQNKIGNTNSQSMESSLQKDNKNEEVKKSARRVKKKKKKKEKNKQLGEKKNESSNIIIIKKKKDDDIPLSVRSITPQEEDEFHQFIKKSRSLAQKLQHLLAIGSIVYDDDANVIIAEEKINNQDRFGSIVHKYFQEDNDTKKYAKAVKKKKLYNCVAGKKDRFHEFSSQVDARLGYAHYVDAQTYSSDDFCSQLNSFYLNDGQFALILPGKIINFDPNLMSPEQRDASCNHNLKACDHFFCGAFVYIFNKEKECIHRCFHEFKESCQAREQVFA